MTLKEVLQPFLPNKEDNFSTLINKNRQFSSLLKEADGRDPAISSLLDVCEVYGYRYPYASHLLEIFQSLGVSENVDFDKFIFFFRLASEIGFSFKKLAPNREDFYKKFSDRLKKISVAELSEVVNSIPWVSENKERCTIKYADHEYLVPVGLETVEEIIKLYHGDDFPYIPQRRDCDDFAWLFKAFLSKHALGNLSVAVLWGLLKDEDEGRTISHAINLVIYVEGNDFKWKLYEPQKELHFYEIGKPGEIWDQVIPLFVVF